jgi:hypothetical protein
MKRSYLSTQFENKKNEIVDEIYFKKNRYIDDSIEP